MKKLETIIIAINAIVFVDFGLAFLIAPEFFGALLDIELTSGTAIADVRAAYGGLSLACGALFAMTLLGRPEWRRPSMFLVALTCAGLALGRLISIVSGDAPGIFTYAMMVTEVGTLVAAAFVLAKGSHRESAATGEPHAVELA